MVWAGSKPAGVERCVVSRTASGWLLEGSLVRRFRAGPAAVNYLVETDPGWATKGVHVEQVILGERRSLQIEVKESRWYVQGREDGRLRGCADVDLGASPATNTLPIRRTRPGVGSRVELTAAWVRFPALAVEPLRQSYERKGERLYVYRSASGFRSEIEVDAFGLVRRYGDYWQAL